MHAPHEKEERGDAESAAMAAAAKSDAANQVSEQQIELGAVLGRGAFGDVYRGKLWETDVAIKVINKSVGDSSIQEIVHEADMMAYVDFRLVSGLRREGCSSPHSYHQRGWVCACRRQRRLVVSLSVRVCCP